MKFYEKRLLDSLQSQTVPEAPLKNVLKAMGHIGQTVGNPLTKTEISILVTITFADVTAGNIIQPVALPLVLQTSLPVYLFGLTDYYGGYLRSINLTRLQLPWILFSAVAGEPDIGIWGNTRNILVAPFAGVIFPQLGDMIISYFVPLAPFGNAFAATVIIHCNNVAYGTFLNSFVSDLITISHIRYFCMNINQFVNPIIFSYQTLFGKVVSDTLDPRLYILPKDFQQQICDLPVNLPIDKNLMIALQLDTIAQAFSWTLFVEKVEPLTHKRKR